LEGEKARIQTAKVRRIQDTGKVQLRCSYEETWRRRVETCWVRWPLYCHRCNLQYARSSS